MPVYEYACKNCSTRFDKLQSINAEPLTECINCGGGPIRRVFQPVGVIFKGSGWYVTDSRSADKSTGGQSSSSKSDSGADSGSKSSEGATSSGSGESAPSKSD